MRKTVSVLAAAVIAVGVAAFGGTPAKAGAGLIAPALSQGTAQVGVQKVLDERRYRGHRRHYRRHGAYYPRYRYRHYRRYYPYYGYAYPYYYHYYGYRRHYRPGFHLHFSF